MNREFLKMVLPGAVLVIAALYFEPLWLFSVHEKPIRHITELAERRVAVGAEGILAPCALRI